MKKLIYAFIAVTAILLLSSCQAKKCECTSVTTIGDSRITGGPITIELDEGQKCKDLESKGNIGGLTGKITCKSIF